ncbi:hypothetical protein L1987_28277 [Smallanthus sonchifolius]|uniref:Uncharacterized protein n=1 Tax=Smallanthus sonchifolius TaxID=185202 RepID=A0ACB9IC72_9ASTR|nr:hypothetical protein L1987_28277 [Smallanthus sonchifolius]
MAAQVFESFDFLDAFIILGGLSAVHILVFLFTVWSVDFKCFIQYSKVTGSSTDEIYFDFRKLCFIYSNEKNTLFKLPYPSKETFGYYLKSTGHGTEAKVQVAAEKWGRNVFEYPQPTFQKLMKENCMEPFFVFLVFCVGLWCLDEYWYNSLFTLFMMFMFESTMAKSRLKTLSELRHVRVDSQMLMAYRLFPTELPMELSIAVNTSLIALARCGIFCTEPFRIPFAGKMVNSLPLKLNLCFDLHVFSGVGGLSDEIDLETDTKKVPTRTLEILASCHALVFVDNKLVGDPLEKATIKGIEWTYKSDEKAMPKKYSIEFVFAPHHLGPELKSESVSSALI